MYIEVKARPRFFVEKTVSAEVLQSAEAGPARRVIRAAAIAAARDSD
jgi:hypothetical protein